MKCLCSKCCTVQPCEDVKVQINYGFNDKKHVLIEGIERVCKVCGWHVDDIEVSKINHDLAVKALEAGNGITTQDTPKNPVEDHTEDTLNDTED